MVNPVLLNNSMAPYLVYQKKFSVALINWELLQQEDKAKQKKKKWFEKVTRLKKAKEKP